MNRMGIITRILYFCISILFCDGEGGFQLPDKVYVSKPSDNYSAFHSELQTPTRSHNFSHSFLKKIAGRKAEGPSIQGLVPQSNQSFKVLLNSPPQEVPLPKFSQMNEMVTSPQTDPSLWGTVGSPFPAEKHKGPSSLLNVHSILKRTVLGYERQDESGTVFPPPALRMSAGCGNPVGGMFDLSDRNLSEEDLRREMDPRHCNTTLGKVVELDASHNNLQMDLGTLLSLLLKMKNVQSIDVSYNSITVSGVLVPNRCDLKHSELLFLNLSHNPLTTLKSICLPSSLKGLDLSFTRINQIPREFARTYFHIEEMDVQGNHFIYNPETLMSLFKSIPKTRMESLSIVNFPQRSPIESLPVEGRRLVMSNCSIVELPEWFANTMRKLLFLDLSNNPLRGFPQPPTSLQNLDLSNSNIQEIANLNIFPNLTVLKIPSNKIKDLPPAYLPDSLKELDISKNQIPVFHLCRAPQELEFLNVSRNLITHLNLNHSHHLTSLDASHNLITELQDRTGIFLPELKYLNLSGNKISFLQPGSLPESLLELDISNNAITIIMEETFGRLTNLNVLTLQGKHFFCSCDLYWFANTYLGSRQLQINGQEELLCSFPLKKRGLSVENSNLTMLRCSLGLQMAITACVAILTMSLLTGLCWRFDGVWYIKMGWYWCMVKRKQYKKRPEDKVYDAFISYSENDALWAKETLLEKLEALEFRVCYHERDFTPGHPVVRNIFHCIENSHKVLFVLSPSFVNSCWCQYELFFAEHRVLNENEDSLIMVVLEDLPPNSIPQKFSKLRKLLKRKTYLKWSQEEHKQKLFWSQLTAVLKTTNEPMALTEENGLC
ncbi:toll-like receptor 2 [Podarcis lilfordi]|uniref:Toll-like receptor 2 n=1 Tax=Podarcis lilfordi TaxID=74358 RepID=A0AA35K477_9SAUR|nr:toll-like receptor 2 [Podarcis lilfordi]